MYVGHVGVALGEYGLRRTLPLWLLIIAAQAPDWMDAGMCIANADRGPHGLYTHGLAAIGIMAVVFAVIALAITRDTVGGLLAALAVVSHYALDYVTGLKPTWRGGPVLGMGLYAHPMADVVLESAVLLAGWLLYRRSLPRAVRNDGMAYAVLFALIAIQIIAGVALFLNVGGNVKC